MKKKYRFKRSFLSLLLAAVLLANAPAAMYAEEIAETEITEEISEVAETTEEETTEAAGEESAEAEEETEIETEAETESEEETELEADTAGNSAATLKNYGLPVFNLVMSGGTSVSTINGGAKATEYKVKRVDIYDKANEANSMQIETAILKGHGNSSWNVTNLSTNGVRGKKSYQIKFEKKVSLYGMPKAKKYLLISNYIDTALIRNQTMYDIAESLDFSPTKTQFIDLYIGGKYLGNYMLCQKVEIGSNSVDLKDDNAIIAEIDHHPNADDIYMRDSFSGRKISVKDTESDDPTVIKSLLNDIISQYQIAEIAAYEGPSEENWQEITSVIDIESFAKYYLLSEFSNNVDTQRGSFYIYKDGAGDLVHAGPLWDQDLALGRRSGEFTDSGYVSVLNDPRLRNSPKARILSNLMMFPQFRALVSDLYFDKMRAACVSELNVIDTTAAYINASGTADHALWNRGSISGCIKSMRKWVANRITFMDLYLGENITLEGGDYLLESAGGNFAVTAVKSGTQGQISPFTLKNTKQIWTFTAADNGDAYYITNAATGLALESKGDGHDRGNAVNTGTYTGGDNQKWRVIRKENGSLVLINKRNGMCLNTVSNKLASKAKLQVNSYTSAASREWKITPYVEEEPTFTLTTDSVTLKVKKSTKSVKISGLIHGDSVISWKSADTKIAKVSTSGTITAGSKVGKTTITITLRSGLKAKVAVQVTK